MTHYIAKPPVSADLSDLSELLERLAESDDGNSGSWAAKSLTTSQRPFCGSTSEPEPPLICVSAGQRRFLGRADSVLAQDIGMGCLTTLE
jgi:hypothetical protein